MDKPEGGTLPSVSRQSSLKIPENTNRAAASSPSIPRDRVPSFMDKKRLASILPEEKKSIFGVLVSDSPLSRPTSGRATATSALSSDVTSHSFHVKNIMHIEEEETQVAENPYASRYRTYPNLIEIYVPESRNGMSVNESDEFEIIPNNPKSLQPLDQITGRRSSIKAIDPAQKYIRVKPPVSFSLAKLEHFVPFLLDLEQAELPPLLKKFSWTLNAPFKEERFQRLISDSIGNNYTLSACNINMKQFQKRKGDEERVGKSVFIPNFVHSPPLSPISRRTSLAMVVEKVAINEELINLDPVELESKTIARQVTPQQRYWFYVECGINNKDLARLEPLTIKKIKALIKPELLGRAAKSEIVLDEIKKSHCLAIKQSIVDYILLDPEERIRLMIPPISDDFSPLICRAPVPWHESLREPKEYLANHLFISNPMMLIILGAYEPFKDTKIVDMSVFSPTILPISVDEFGSILKAQCHAFKTRMIHEYISINLDGFQISHLHFWPIKRNGTQSRPPALIPMLDSIGSIFSLSLLAQ